VVLEPFDRPGLLLSIGAQKSVRLLPESRQPSAAQRWRLRPLPSPQADACGPRLRVVLESVEQAGLFLRRMRGGGAALEVAADAGASAFVLRAPLALYAPLAHWAASNVTCTPTHGAACRAAYLLNPLRELLDETYSSHLCVLEPSVGGAPAPGFCH